jgi:hypothetical protein
MKRAWAGLGDREMLGRETDEAAVSEADETLFVKMAKFSGERDGR